MAFDGEEVRGQPASTRNPTSKTRVRGLPARRAHGANQRVVGMTLITAGLATLASGMSPGPLVLSTLSSLLMLAAAACVVIAYLVGQRLFASHLTLWDQAAALGAYSLIVSLEVDGAAVQAFRESQALATLLGG